jgi:hypothetical protein
VLLVRLKCLASNSDDHFALLDLRKFKEEL